MTHKLWLIKSNSRIDITPIVGSLSWRSNQDELGVELSFDIANSDSKYFPKNPCDLGNMVILENGSEITRGIILDESKAGRNPVAYTAYDYAFFLNKSDAVYRFKNIRADQAIKKIFSDFNIPAGSIAGMSTIINKIYNNKKVSDIIKNILRIVKLATGKKYMIEMQKGKMCIVPRKGMKIKAVFKLDGTTYNATDFIADPTRSRSVTDMINSIQIISDDKVLLTKEDTSMVKKFGKLQKTVTLDKKEKKNAAQVAKSELDDLSKIAESGKVILLGDDRVKAGRVLEINEKITGLKGDYTVKDVTHEVANNIHKMTVNMEGD